MLRTRFSQLAAAVGIGALCALLAGCASAPTAPSPPSVDEAEPPAPVAAAATPAPPAYLRVSASRLNVREAPSATARALAKVSRNTRLIRLGGAGEWVEVQLADGARGWVHGKYVAAEPECPADSVAPTLVSEPVVAFVEGAGHGRVVVEGTVAKSGEVVAVAVKENSTGSTAAESAAVDELRRMRFAPFVRNCRPVAFVYVYTRTY